MEISDYDRNEHLSLWKNEKELAKEEQHQALQFVGAIMDEVSVLGFNDSEIGDLRALLGKLEKGLVSPKQAREQAQAIKDHKMDYH